jgi:hypothetical protein
MFFRNFGTDYLTSKNSNIDILGSLRWGGVGVWDRRKEKKDIESDNAEDGNLYGSYIYF